MNAAGLAVDINLTGIVTHADVEQVTHALGLLDFDFSLVPDTCHEILVLYAGELGFRTKRNGDFAAQCFGFIELSGTAGLSVVDFKHPLTV